MNFIVLVFVFLAVAAFALHAFQVRLLVSDGVKPWGHFPAFLVKKMSDLVYMISSFLFGGFLIISLTQIIIGTNQDHVLRKYPGLTWATIYLFFVTVLYILLVIKNRSIADKS